MKRKDAHWPAAFPAWGFVGMSLAAGVLGLCFAVGGNGFAALVGLALSVAWGTMSLVASNSVVRRVQAESRQRVVDRVLCRFLCDLTKVPDVNAAERAELVDRVHSIASAALKEL